MFLSSPANVALLLPVERDASNCGECIRRDECRTPISRLTLCVTSYPFQDQSLILLPLLAPYNLPLRRPRQPDNSRTQPARDIKTRLVPSPLQHPHIGEISRRAVHDAATPDGQ